MTGYDIFSKSVVLMGYSASDRQITSGGRLKNSAEDAINSILADLKCGSISNLSDEMTITAAKADALCYGAAMLLTMIDGDAEKNQIFTGIYNAKRAAALSQSGSIADTLPRVTG